MRSKNWKVVSLSGKHLKCDEYIRFGYGIETFFEKEVMILLSWKQ